VNKWFTGGSMLKSLIKINNVKTRNDIDKDNDGWLFYLYVTREHNYNLNHLKSLSELNNKSVLNYVIKSLYVLNEDTTIEGELLYYVEETLKWMEVAKCGSKAKRKEWLKKGFDLYVHNIGSSQIYKDTLKSSSNNIIEVLIKTHGLIGQYLKGEVNFYKNVDLYNLIDKKLITKEKLRLVLISLNKAIIKAISTKLWNKVESKVINAIDNIINNKFNNENYYDSDYIVKRLIKLRSYGTTEEQQHLLDIFKENENVKKYIGEILEKLELWFFDSALSDFSFDEIIKILYIISYSIKDKDNYEHLSFEKVMNNIYIDYNENKVINIYKRRIIEKYLNDITFDDIKNNNLDNQHIKPYIVTSSHTILFSFTFSLVSTKLIEFCEVAYGTDSLFNKAVFLLYDLFGFRRDQYDRFYNEIDYLKTMNESLSKKAKILEYIKGKSILDVGPGGGALMDLILEKLIDADVMGIDISSNVIEELTKKKEKENKKWNVIKGDALELQKYIPKCSVDTIIYSSIIHELFSYIPFNGKKFNYDTIKSSLKSAYDVLPDGGRIIIRDGIKTEDVNSKRVIKFKNVDDLNILDRYCHDFEGRKITYEKIDNDEVKMLVNDAMEFLYTYTWGESSYSLEVKEQFGYFTPNEYINFIKNIFNNKCNIVECLHFLQDGYEEHLLDKIEFYDESHNPTRLPDSTCIIVIEKRN
jgi:2-polyprenyl-3-methyl-5-hydroxy-6-metoxy-1,4-benzoquinol methylase